MNGQAKTAQAKTVQAKTSPAQQPGPASVLYAAKWLKPSRIRAQAIVLALCVWGVCAVDFATPGLFDRAGNIKFQDFLPSYVAARLIAQGRATELRTTAGTLLCPAGPILVSSRRENLGRRQPSHPYRLYLFCMEVLSKFTSAFRHGLYLRDCFSSALSFFRARPDVRSRAGVLHDGLSCIPRRS